MCSAGPLDLSPIVSAALWQVVEGFFIFLLLESLLLILRVNKLKCLQQRQHLTELFRISGDLSKNNNKKRINAREFSETFTSFV